MEKSEGGGFPLKKLVRQLDFTAAPAAAALPEHPQPQPPRQQAVPQQQQLLLVPMQSQSPPPSIRPVKLESPKARSRTNVEVKDSTPKKPKQCNCKHSKCLKLREAVEATLERNPNAFRPKIGSSPHGSRDNKEEVGEALLLGKHNKGCHCKKSGCLKKYCECFQANILCSENCKCIDCKNFEGSEERQALFHADHANNMAYIQQAANAAITGAVGSSGYGSPPVSKKRKGQELFYGPTSKDQSIHKLAHLQQANHIKASAHSSSPSSIPVMHAGNGAPLGPSNFTYRSLLADIIQPQDLKELCSVLVVFSDEVAKTLADQRNATEMPAEDRGESSAAPSAQDRFQIPKESETEKAVVDNCSSGNNAEKISPHDSNSDGADVSKGRPMSPGTLALMCDEQDAMFMASSSPKGLMGSGCNTSSQLPHGQGVSEVYAEQERVVLTKLRDCLNRLITLGEIKETKCSSLARTDSGDQKEPLSNGTPNSRTESRNQQESFSNGVAKITVPPMTSQTIIAPHTAPHNDLL